jgi:hypothetical protein
MSTRTLGTSALICAPALLIDAIWTATMGQSPIVTGICSFFFMLGWLCSNIGMQQMQALGTGLAAKIVLRIQFSGVFLAMFFGLFEATKLVPEESLLFTITDLCWPFMLFMIVVGVMVIRANRWAGWQRFIPLICALWLPVGIVTSLPAESIPAFENISMLIGFGWTAVAWTLLALIVRSNATLAGAAVEAGGEPVLSAG